MKASFDDIYLSVRNKLYQTLKYQNNQNILMKFNTIQFECKDIPDSNNELYSTSNIPLINYIKGSVFKKPKLVVYRLPILKRYHSAYEISNALYDIMYKWVQTI